MNKNEESFGYRFGMLYRINISIFRKSIESFGLTPSMVPFAAELWWLDKPMTQHELSRMLVIDKGACTRALAALEEKGIVKRYVNPGKKREKLAEITPFGRKTMDELLKILRRSGEIFTKGFDKEEKKMVLDLMNRMIENGIKELGNG